MIRILLVDDQNIVRQGLKALLAPQPELEVIGIAEDGYTAIEKVETLKPDVVLIDIEMPRMNGIIATHKICQQFPKTKVIVLSSHEDPECMAQALQVGAEGYLHKNTSAKNLEQAISSAYQKTVWERSNQIIEKKLSFSIRNVSSNHILKQYGSRSRNVLAGNQKISDRNKSSNSQAIKKPFVWQKLLKLERKSQIDKNVLSKLPKWCATKLIIFPILIAMVATVFYVLNRHRPQVSSISTTARAEPPKIGTIAALGRIEPKGEVISLSAPTSLEAVQVEKLLVEAGDLVKKKEIVAILDGRERQQALLDEAKIKYKVAEANLSKVKAGAKYGEIRAKKAAISNIEAELAGEIQTQQATILKLTAELDNARTEFQRNQQIHKQGAISASKLDSKRLTLKTAKEQLNEAKATLERTQLTLNAKLEEARAALEETAEVRPIDVQIAEAELEQAQASINKAQADMDLAYVRAPINGEILDIHTRPGEALNEKGIAAMGQTNQMMVITEIDQSDIERIKTGQKAIITSGVFSEELSGEVHRVGSLISKNDVLDTDPAADEDARVVEVEILLKPKSSQKVARLTNLEVDVVIKL